MCSSRRQFVWLVRPKGFVRASVALSAEGTRSMMMVPRRKWSTRQCDFTSINIYALRRCGVARNLDRSLVVYPQWYRSRCWSLIQVEKHKINAEAMLYCLRCRYVFGLAS